MQSQDLLLNDELEQAWRAFVQGGVIDQNIVRPDIARSWFRCIKHREAGDLQAPLSARIIRVKQEKNRELIEAAQSILHDVAAMLTSSMQHFSVLLLDSEGDIIEKINHDTNLICLGHHCSELNSGTNAGGLALVDGAGVEVVGYEHLYPYAHNWHTIAVPIRNYKNGIVGVLGVLNMDGPCPVLTMQTVSLGAQLIETRLKRDQLFMDVSSLMVERIKEATVLVNQDGLILDLNQPCADLLQNERDLLLGENICDYWSDENKDTLLSGSIRMDNPPKILIKPRRTALKAKPFLCNLNKFIIKPDSDSSLILFTFNRADPYDRLETLEELNGSRLTNAFGSLIGNSPTFIRVIEDAQRAARSTSNVLIEGKSGTGKELMARAIHQESKRSGTFLAINCGSIPKELLHSELFGYEEGAFTGAKKGGNPGKFELANGGTLFLDEIGEMPLDMQVSLLRFLEDKTVTRMGGQKSKSVDVRIVAATNRNLAEEVLKGNFREDLFYRINVVYLKMPPLSEHKEDIPLLVEHLLHRLGEKNKNQKIKLSQEVMNRLCAHDWPGNVRELQNVLESSIIQARNDMVTMSCLPEYLRDYPELLRSNPSGNLKEVEKALILDTLSKYNDNISKSAQELGITRTTLYNKIDQLGIKRSKVAY